MVKAGRLTLFGRSLIIASAGAAMLAAPVPLVAQDNSENRIRKLEAEVRALQRKVFPGGDDRFFEPEITAPVQPQTEAPGAPSTSALTDVLARLDALESQLQRLTAQTEVNQNAFAQLSERVEALEAAQRVAEAPPPLPTEGAIDTNNVVGARSNDGELPPVAEPSPERLARVEAITKPATEDSADDEYVYGFRLWDAGLYPEAQQQLTTFVEANPDHWRATYGRNLLGRAYLDDGKPREAAPWFLSNYQADKQSARAGDSLLYLGKAMIALDDTDRACIALAEFADTYPALASGRLSSDYEETRREVNCN